LARVKRVVKLLSMVNATDDFTDHPRVANGCSDVFVKLWGEAGKHSRSAVGMASLPGGVAVEVEAIVEVE
ncbi:MAG TPA: RidA family protein, partial [Chloroflexota bacterium]|nr:RidA family protein [Chloroflexota bacterium]